MIDWQLLMCYLTKYLKSHWGIQKHTKMGLQHIKDLSCGRCNEPRFNTGVKLLDLAYDLCTEEEFRRLRNPH